MSGAYRISPVGFEPSKRYGGECKVAFVVPAFQAERTLRASIESIRRAAPDGSEVVVVDDASFDETPAIAAEFADVVVTRPCQGGAARCRNDGARVARGEILFFVDADVTVERSAVEGVLRHLDEGADAVFGAYTALLPVEARNDVTNFKNLLHHYTHVRNAGRARTFWSGFGAVRRGVFVAVRGFDASVTTGADVEDIHLGYRLWRAGFTTVLDPTLQARHHKQYTFRSLLGSDIVHRAVPWLRTMLRLRDFSSALNVSTSAVASSIAAVAAPVALGASFFAGPIAAAVGVALLFVWLALNLRFLDYVGRQWNVRGMVISTALLYLYFLYSPIGAALGVVAEILRRGRTAGLNWLQLERANGGSAAVEVTVAMVDFHAGHVAALDALPALEPWWELIVVGPRAPSNLPVGAEFVSAPRGANHFQLARRAFDVCRGDFFVVLDSGLVPEPAWLDRVRHAARRADLAVGGSFGHDRRRLRSRASQVTKYWLWRPERKAAWTNDHPFTNVGFRTEVARALGGLRPELIARLTRFGARSVRFDPEMAVRCTRLSRFWEDTRYVGGMARFRAAAVTRYFDLSPLHRMVLVALSPLFGLSMLLGIVRTAVADKTADRTFWLSLPLTTVALASYWIGRDLGVISPHGRGGLVLRTPDELAELMEKQNARDPLLSSR
jgi:glycosyltransferase involved in cell wall biosynthesis